MILCFFFQSCPKEFQQLGDSKGVTHTMCDSKYDPDPAASGVSIYRSNFLLQKSKLKQYWLFWSQLSGSYYVQRIFG